jgi:heterodisulfide reductase subunit C
MDIKPHQVIRHVQLGWRQKLLQSTTVWVCLSCEMCTTYCQNSVDVTEVINYLRNLATHSTIEPKERSLAVFHQTFLEELHRYGRVNELWLMNAFNLKPNILKEKLNKGTLKDEILLGLTLWRKGKLNMLPKRCKAIREIQEIYRQKRGDIV